MSALTEAVVQDEVVAPRQIPVLPCVNLLPPEIAERKHARVIQMRLGGVVVAAAAVVGLIYFQVAGGVGSAQDRVTAAQGRGATLQHQIAGLSNVTATQKQLELAQAAVSKALGSEVRWSRYLNDLSITLPSNIWVTSVAINEAAAPTGASTTSTAAASAGTAAGQATSLGTLTISGKALSFNDVAVWLETLAKEKGYTNAWLTQGTTEKIDGIEVVDFTSSVGFTPDVLSKRYTQQAGN